MRDFWKNIDLENVKGILLDLDNTLYHYESCHTPSYDFCKSYLTEFLNIDSERFDNAWNESRKRVHKDLNGQGASHSRLLYFQKTLEKLCGMTMATLSLEMEEKYWSTFLSHMEWNDGAEEFLASALEKGVMICIVTDLTAAIQLRKWEKLNLGRFVRYMVSSEESGIEKPEPYIFELALEKMALKADEVIMIGDSEKKDIQGAGNMGIKSYLIKY